MEHASQKSCQKSSGPEATCGAAERVTRRSAVKADVLAVVVVVVVVAARTVALVMINIVTTGCDSEAENPNDRCDTNVFLTAAESTFVEQVEPGWLLTDERRNAMSECVGRGEGVQQFLGPFHRVPDAVVQVRVDLVLRSSERLRGV